MKTIILGLICFTIGIIIMFPLFNSVLENDKVIKEVPCYDNLNNKVVGLTCIEEGVINKDLNNEIIFKFQMLIIGTIISFIILGIYERVKSK